MWEGVTVGENLRGERGARFHPYGAHWRRTVTPDAFRAHGDTYPALPVAWQDSSDESARSMYEDAQPRASRRLQRCVFEEIHSHEATSLKHFTLKWQSQAHEDKGQYQGRKSLVSEAKALQRG